MNLKEIAEKYLKDNGYDGLFDDECGCQIGDLMPCDAPSIYCVAGYKVSCDCGDHDFHICADKHEEK